MHPVQMEDGWCAVAMTPARFWCSSVAVGAAVRTSAADGVMAGNGSLMSQTTDHALLEATTGAAAADDPTSTTEVVPELWAAALRTAEASPEPTEPTVSRAAEAPTSLEEVNERWLRR